MYIGVDGCPAGWVAVQFIEDGYEATSLYEDIEELWAAHGAAADQILIDTVTTPLARNSVRDATPAYSPFQFELQFTRRPTKTQKRLRRTALLEVSAFSRGVSSTRPPNSISSSAKQNRVPSERSAKLTLKSASGH